MLTTLDLTQSLQLQNSRQNVNYLNLLTSTVSHEMLTPLNCAVRFSSWLVNSKDDYVSGFAKIISNSLAICKFQVLDLLDRGRISKDEVNLHFEFGNILNTVEEICSLLSPKAHDKDIKLVVSGKNLQGKFQMLEIQRTSQVMMNLISNAIKFSSENSSVIIKIKSCKSTVSPKYDTISVSVSDRGLGIEANELSTMFDPFFRTRN